MTVLSLSKSDRPFTTTAAMMLTAGIAIAILIAAAASSANRNLLFASTFVSLGSLFVGLLAMIPGVLMEMLAPKSSATRSSADGDINRQVKQPLTLISSFLVGIVIKLLGTVALLALCRYQLAESTQAVAAMVLFWYLTLSAIEVITLVSISRSHARISTRP